MAADLAPGVGRNFYAIMVQSETGQPAAFLLNSTCRLVALVATCAPALYETCAFLTVPATPAFTARAFSIADPRDMHRPLSSRGVRDLAPDELKDIECHQPPRIGDVFFNCFD